MEQKGKSSLDFDFQYEYKLCVHGDLHGGNALVSDNEIFFYDFEYSGYGLICYELSIFRWSTLIGNRESQWETFFKGVSFTN